MCGYLRHDVKETLERGGGHRNVVLWMTFEILMHNTHKGYIEWNHEDECYNRLQETCRLWILIFILYITNLYNLEHNSLEKIIKKDIVIYFFCLYFFPGHLPCRDACSSLVYAYLRFD
jgi:hypothetical protein